MSTPCCAPPLGLSMQHTGAQQSSWAGNRGATRRERYLGEPSPERWTWVPGTQQDRLLQPLVGLILIGREPTRTGSVMCSQTSVRRTGVARCRRRCGRACSTAEWQQPTSRGGLGHRRWAAAEEQACRGGDAQHAVPGTTGVHLHEGLVRCSASEKSRAPMPLRVSAAAISPTMAARSAAGMQSGALQWGQVRAGSVPCLTARSRLADAWLHRCGMAATWKVSPAHLPRRMRRMTQSAAQRTRLAMSSPLQAGTELQRVAGRMGGRG